MVCQLSSSKSSDSKVQMEPCASAPLVSLTPGDSRVQKPRSRQAMDVNHDLHRLEAPITSPFLGKSHEPTRTKSSLSLICKDTPWARQLQARSRRAPPDQRSGPCTHGAQLRSRLPSPCAPRLRLALHATPPLAPSPVGAEVSWDEPADSNSNDMPLTC